MSSVENATKRAIDMGCASYSYNNDDDDDDDSVAGDGRTVSVGVIIKKSISERTRRDKCS